MKNYFNTVPESEQNRDNYEIKAKTQNKAVMKLYRVYKQLSPSQAWGLLNMPDVPLTSIRRAINTLTRRDYLFKTLAKVQGRYGRSERVWSLIESVSD